MGFGAEIGVWVWCGDRRWAMGLLWVLFGFAVGCVGLDWRWVVGLLWVLLMVGEGGVDGLFLFFFLFFLFFMVLMVDYGLVVVVSGVRSAAVVSIW